MDKLLDSQLPSRFLHYTYYDHSWDISYFLISNERWFLIQYVVGFYFIFNPMIAVSILVLVLVLDFGIGLGLGLGFGCGWELGVGGWGFCILGWD
jgi:hypothetical protein